MKRNLAGIRLCAYAFHPQRQVERRHVSINGEATPTTAVISRQVWPRPRSM